MTTRSFAADLALTDLDDRHALTDFVARYALGPARRMMGTPAPHPSEGERPPHPEPYTGNDSHTQFGPIIKGLVLWSTLFPQASPSFGELEAIGRVPHSAWMDGAFELGLWTGYGKVRRFVDGLFGDVEALPWELPTKQIRVPPSAPRRNDEAMAELRRMQALLLRLYGPAEEWGDIAVRQTTGLRHVDLDAARELDTILRREVHARIVRFGTDEPVLADEAPDGEAHILRVDGGVFAAQVPETLAGALALDYLEGLAAGRNVARCAACGRAVVITNHQAARVEKGQPVYHPDCKGEARLAYFRTYQRDRRLVALGLLLPSEPDAPGEARSGAGLPAD